jgi:HAMP domain-containing protein
MADLYRIGAVFDATGTVRGTKTARESINALNRAIEQVNREFEEGTHRSQQRGSRNLERMADQVERKTNRMKTAMKGLFSGLGAAGAGGFGALASSIGVFIPQMGFAVQAVSQLVGTVGRVSGAFRGAMGGMGGFIGLLGGITAGAVALIATLGALAIALAGILAVVVPLAAGIHGLKSAFDILSQGTTIAADFETVQLQFAVLLRDFEMAQTRVNELAEFSAATPFQLMDIAGASRMLQVFTGEALSTGDGLKLIGDAAAGANRPLSEVSMWVGRLYAGLQGGQPIGEATMRLLEMGLLTPMVKGELDALAQTANDGGKAFETLWSRARAELLKFQGSMELQSQTFNGLVSTMKDNYSLLLKELGQPIMEEAKPVLREIIGLLGEMRQAAIGIQPQIREVAQTLAAMFRVARENPQAIFSSEGVDFIKRKLLETSASVGAAITQELKAAGFDLEAILARLQEKGFWGILGDTFEHLAIQFGKNLLKYGTKAIQGLGQSILGTAGDVGVFLGGKLAGASPEEIASRQQQFKEGLFGGKAGREAEERLAKAKQQLYEIERATLGEAEANRRMWSRMFGQDPLQDSRNKVDMLVEEARRNIAQETKEADQRAGNTLAQGTTMADNFSMNRNGQIEMDTGLPAAAQRSATPKDRNAAEAFYTRSMTPTQRRDKQMEEVNRLNDAGAFGDPAKYEQAVAHINDIWAKAMEAQKETTAGGSGISELARQAESLQEKMRTPQEVFDAEMAQYTRMAQAGLISQETFQRAVEASRDKFIQAQEAMARAAEQSAARQATPLQNMIARWGTLAAQQEQATVQLGSSIERNMSGALGDWATGTATAGQAFAQMAAGITQDIVRMTAKLWIQYLLTKAIGGMGGAGGIGKSVGIVAGAIFHAGGRVGDPGPTRTVPASVFAGAARYHNGGKLGNDEMPVIAKEGEEIITEKEADRLRESFRGDSEAAVASSSSDRTRSGEAPAVNIINVTNPTEIASAVASNPDAVMNVISRNRKTIKSLLQ